MYGSTIYPFNFCNRNGIPMIETSQVTVTAQDVVYTIPNKAFRSLNDKGLVLLRIKQAVPSGTTATLPVALSSNSVLQPVTRIGGADATVEQVSPVGIYLAYYDKSGSTIQVIE